MGLYVELMCDEHKGWPETPAFAGKIDLRCHSDAGDNPQGPTVAAARAAGKAAGWIVRGNYCCCPGCKDDPTPSRRP